MKWPRSLIIILVVMFLGACAPSQQARGVKTSGFLGDYSKLQPGGKGEPALIYLNPKTDFRAYDKFLMDRVTIWRGENSNLDDVPEKDLHRLALLLQVKIMKTLKREGFTRVKKSGPGVMKIRAAITEAQQSSVVMDIITTVVPVGRILSGGKKLATGTNSFVGKASIEGEITNSQTGEVLGAMVDRRAGGKTLEGGNNSWDDVEKAFQFWADRFGYRMCQLRGGNFCVPPE